MVYSAGSWAEIDQILFSDHLGPTLEPNKNFDSKKHFGPRNQSAATLEHYLDFKVVAVDFYR